MTFYMREYSSDEKYDLAKFLNYQDGAYDVIDSPFLYDLKELPTVSYYKVSDGLKEVDLIAMQVYGDAFMAYLIQYYNNDFRDYFPEGTVLNLFSLEDLETVYYNLNMKSNLEEEE